METKKLIELGFVKSNIFQGLDSYMITKDHHEYVYNVKKDTDIFDCSYIQIQYQDDAIYLNSTDEFLKVFNSENPWRLARQIGEVCYE